MKNILHQIRLCGILPCVSGGSADAIPSYLKALAFRGFPAAVVDCPSFGVEMSAFEAIFRHPEIAVIAMVSGARQSAGALHAGVRWIARPPGESETGTALPGGALLLCEAEPSEETPADGRQARLLVAGHRNAADIPNLLSMPQVCAVAHRLCVQGGQADKQADLLKRLWADTLSFSLAHIGINAVNANAATATAMMFSSLLGLPCIPGSAADYAGTIIEVMKEGGRGTHGHIGIATNDLERGMYFAECAGFTFDLASRKNDASGRAILYYLTDALEGFAVHLLQK